MHLEKICVATCKYVWSDRSDKILNINRLSDRIEYVIIFLMCIIIFYIYNAICTIWHCERSYHSYRSFHPYRWKYKYKFKHSLHVFRSRLSIRFCWSSYYLGYSQKQHLDNVETTLKRRWNNGGTPLGLEAIMLKA